jgi:6-phosphogluconolactonase
MSPVNALAGLRGRLVVEVTPEAIARRLADDLIAGLRQRLAQVGVAHLALSGGKSPQGLYRALARDSRWGANEWNRTHIWMVDERCVPETDPQSNFGMIRSLLIEHVPIPAAQVHPMPVTLPDGDRRYEDELRAALAAASEGRLDAAVMGVGPDGHTASLFPHSPVLDEFRRWVRFNDGDTVMPPRPRMTLTFPILCAVRFVAVLVTEASKQQALRAASGAPDDVHEHPVVGVKPAADGRLVWYLDRDAVEGRDAKSSGTAT